MSVRQFFDRLRTFVKEWGPVLLFFTVSFTFLGIFWQIMRLNRKEERLIQAEETVLGAKLRIEKDRQSIAETEKTVTDIQERLQSNKVPDRLKSIEDNIVGGVVDNRELIRKQDENVRKLAEQTKKLAEKQAKALESLSDILQVPKDDIDGTPALEELDIKPVIPNTNDDVIATPKDDQ